METKFNVFFIVALCSIILFVTNCGCTSSSSNIAGTYTHNTSTGDTYTITINSDGTYSADSYSHQSSGTWTVEDNELNLNPSVPSWQADKNCGSSDCPLKQIWVPSGNIKSYKIGTNQITDDNGIVWIKSP